MGSAYQFHIEEKLGRSPRQVRRHDRPDHNIFKVPVAKVDQTKVVTTIFNGKVVYKK